MAKTTVYTQISKELTFDDSDRIGKYPTKAHAEQLLQTVWDDREVFKEVFRYHRYLRLGTNAEEYEIQDILFQAWAKGVAYWQTKFVEL